MSEEKMTEEQENMLKERLIEQILEREWMFFQMVHHTEGRAECQNNPDEFVVMRKSQWETMPINILRSYLEDLILAKHKEINIVGEKYARMMEFSAPDEYAQIKDFITPISQEKKDLVNEIVEIYLKWEEEMIEKYPKLASRARSLHSKDDTPNYVSIETYLKGELSSYSIKTLKLYFEYIQESLNQGINLAKKNLENIAKMKGYESLEDVEKKLV